MPLCLSPIIVGYPAFESTSVSTAVLNAAANWYAISFVARNSKTPSKLMAMISAVNGSIGTSDSSCSLYSDNQGKPGTLIEARSTVTAAPTAGNMLEFTGFTSTSALTEGSMYWWVFKNLAASPASNYPTYRYGAADSAPLGPASVSNSWGWVVKTSTDSGSNWSSGTRGIIPMIRVEFSDGSFSGLPVQNIVSAASLSSSLRIYGTKVFGGKLVTPSDTKLRVTGILLGPNKIGTPSGDIRARIYQGNTRVATSFSVPKNNVGTIAS